MVEPLNTKAWVIVPSDPTTEMIGAATRVDFDNEDEVAMTINLWHAMVSSSPALPVVDGGEMIKCLELAADFCEGVRFFHANHEDGDCEPHWSEQSEAETAAQTIRQSAALISSQKQEIERLTKEQDEAFALLEGVDLLGKKIVSAAESRVQSLEEALRKIESDLQSSINVHEFNSRHMIAEDSLQDAWKMLDLAREQFQVAANSLRILLATARDALKENGE